MGKFIAGAAVGAVIATALWMAEVKRSQDRWFERYYEMAALICELPLSVRIEKAPALVCPVQRQ